MDAQPKPKVLLCVAGGIAAYKSVVLLRELLERGCVCKVAMTRSAHAFVGAATFSGLTGQAPLTEFSDHPGEVHVELAQWADAIVVAPATANLLSRAAMGAADNVVLATLLCNQSPVLFAPAMHESMWNHPATQHNVGLLTERGARWVGPEHGALASGEQGMGRMSEPINIANALDALVVKRRDLHGVRIIVTAGPTYEDIDPVRFIGNRSSGKTGYALASCARARGATVTLISGPVWLSPPSHVSLVEVRSAKDMHDAVAAHMPHADVLIMAAAVADYRPHVVSPHKLHKDEQERTLTLMPTEDILANAGQKLAANSPLLVGFSLETDNVVGAAKRKLLRKKLDLVVANRAQEALENDSTQVTLIDHDGEQTLPSMPKAQAADAILDAVAKHWRRRQTASDRPTLLALDGAQ